MNKRAFRLVFDRRRGMKVAAAETTRSTGKAAGGETRASRPARAVAVAAALATLSGGALESAMAQAVKVKAPQFNATTNRAYDRSFNLPQIYDKAAGASTRGWTLNSDGSASPNGYAQARWRVENGGKLGVFDQGELEKVIANWNSFDIAPGHEVYVKQSLNKDKAVSALFKIWSEDPSLIMGSLRADREVILQNANGVIFGPGATVDTGSLVATALSMADKTFLNGLRATTDGSAVFTADGTDFQATHLGLTTQTVNGVSTIVADGSGPARVLVDPGARIRTAAGGDVLLVAPQVENRGTIEVTNGQAILAAGQKVYLASSGDSAQRGLIVAVDAYSDAQRSAQNDLGVVENLARGLDQIKAETGSANLVGLLVKQNGVINATTAVKGMNGGIFLQAQKSTVLIDHSVPNAVGTRGDVTPHSTVTKVRQAGELGTVEVGADSLTQVSPVQDQSALQLADDPFNASRIFIDGQSITVAEGAKVLAAGGDIRLRAASRVWNTAGTDLSSLLFVSTKYANVMGSTNLSSTLNAGLPNDGSSIRIASGAQISAAGSRDVAVDGNRYQGAKRVFRIELADSPLQRGGVLYREEVFYDKREASSVKVADLNLDAKNVLVSAQEMSAKGGSVALLSQGSLNVAGNALIDVSGGNLKVSESKIKVSSLVKKKVGTYSLYDADASQI
jgi:filamentous hemagglutinin